MPHLVCGGEAVAQWAGVTVQPGVGVPPDGVVGEEWLSDGAGDLEEVDMRLERMECSRSIQTPDNNCQV